MFKYLLLDKVCAQNLGAEDLQSVVTIICDGFNEPDSRKAETTLCDL